MNELPEWAYAAGGLAVVALAIFSGKRWGAYLAVVIVFGMIVAARQRGNI